MEPVCLGAQAVLVSTTIEGVCGVVLSTIDDLLQVVDTMMERDRIAVERFDTQSFIQCGTGCFCCGKSSESLTCSKSVARQKHTLEN